MIAFYTIVRREISRFLRIWSQTLLPPAITMSLYFLIFGQVMGSRIGTMHGMPYIEYLVPGLVMMSIINNAYGNIVSSFFSIKFQRNLEEMLAAPIASGTILNGFLLGAIIRGLLVGVIVTIIASFFSKITIVHLGVVIFAAFITALLFSLMGFINAIFARKFDDISIIPTFILTPLTYLGGVFYSVEVLPAGYQHITYINPIFYMVNIFRYGMLGVSDTNVVTSFAVLSLVALILYVVCYQLLDKGVGIKN